MQKFSTQILIAAFTFLIGISATFIWFLSPEIPNIPPPEMNIGCNFTDVSKCRISEKNKKFWEEKILSRFNEKPLSDKNDEESYRLILLPTFDSPIAIRIAQSQNQKILVVKKLSGKAGFGLENFGKLSLEKNRVLTDEEWNYTKILLAQMSFWNTSPLSDEIAVNDGASWTLEGEKDNNFHQVDRILPDDKFQAICSHFLKLSEFEKEY